jgi:hypothetical protein
MALHEVSQEEDNHENKNRLSSTSLELIIAR